MDPSEPLISRSQNATSVHNSSQFQLNLLRIRKVIQTLLVLYISWTSPYTFGFINEMSVAWRITDYVVSVIFLVDAIVTFVTSFTVGVTSVVPLVIEVVPTGLFFELLPTLPGVAKVWSFFRLVVVLLKLYKIFADVDTNKHQVFSYFLKWAKLIFVSLLSIHITGCICYLIASTNQNRKRTWLSLEDEEYNLEGNKELFMYITAVYWATTAFTTVGYGDLHPVNSLEMLFAILSMLFNMGLATYVTNGVGELLATNIFSEPLVEPTTQLITFSQMKSSVTRAYLFRNVSDCLVHQVIKKSKVLHFPRETALQSTYDFPDTLYILIDGEMERLEKFELGNRSSVRICGALGVIFFIPQLFDVQTVRDSTLLKLDRETFLQLLQFNVEDRDVVIDNITKMLREQTYEGKFGSSVHDWLNNKLDRGESDIIVSLKFACKRKDSKLLLHLIKEGSDLEELYDYQQTILHVAVNEGAEVCIIETLLEHMKDPNARDSSGKLAICYAIQKRQRYRDGKFKWKPILQLFIEKGVNLPQEKAFEYYDQAVKYNDLELLRLIYDLRGDINVTDVDGRTPLYWAIDEGRTEVVILLLRLNANVEIRDISGWTPLEFAIVREREDIKKLISNHVAAMEVTNDN